MCTTAWGKLTAGNHGYTFGAGNEEDFILYYRHFVRNQIAEVNTMRDTTWTGPLPTSGDLWVGLFDTFRRGFTPWWTTSPGAAPNAMLARGAIADPTPVVLTNEPTACALPTLDGI